MTISEINKEIAAIQATLPRLTHAAQGKDSVMVEQYALAIEHISGFIVGAMQTEGMTPTR